MVLEKISSHSFFFFFFFWEGGGGGGRVWLFPELYGNKDNSPDGHVTWQMTLCWLTKIQ